MSLPTNDERVIAVMGLTGSGKSHLIGQLIGDMSITGDSLESVTQQVTGYEITVDGMKTIIIDTPGMDDSQRTDAQVLEMIAAWIKDYYKKKILLSGIIYVHDISSERVSGSATTCMNIFRELCGEDFYKNVVFVPNMWHHITNMELGRNRVAQLKGTSYWGPMIHKGAVVAQEYYGNKEDACRIIATILKNNPRNTKLGKELVDEKKKLVDTGAGQVADRRLVELAEKQQKELAELLKLHAADVAAKAHASKAEQEMLEETFKLAETRMHLEIERLNKAMTELRREHDEDTDSAWVKKVVVLRVAIGVGLLVAGPVGGAVAGVVGCAAVNCCCETLESACH